MSSKKLVNRGYVNAESIIGIRNPTYDEDNLNYEARMIMGPRHQITLTTPSPRPIQGIDIYEKASLRMIKKAIDRIR
ncbi:MAG: hypothetical protein WC584_04575 [Candidatus Pacearchaeota archaeon]